MTCIPTRSAIVCVASATLSIVVNRRRYLFEWDRNFGPMPVTKDGRGRFLNPRHPFWLAVTGWQRWGCPMNADGSCAWVDVDRKEWLA